MPKGDRLKLKADPEDGTTPIANLLLEAVAMAKISGLQKGAIVYLWRKTYGWIGSDGKRNKEAKITLGDWKKALDRDKSHIAKALSSLCEMNIMCRRVVDDIWGGYYYSFNTDISKWNSHSINLAKLAETVMMANLPTVGNNATVEDIDDSRQELPQLAETTTIVEKDDSTVVKNTTPQLSKTPLPSKPNEPPPPKVDEIQSRPLHYIPPLKETLNKDKEKVDVKITSPIGEKTKDVFSKLDKLRGYRPSTKRGAEAKSIMKMLKTYTPDQIIGVWQELKNGWWSDKELFMMTVESQIGAKLKNGANQGHIKSHPTDTLSSGRSLRDPHDYKANIGKPLR